MSLDDASRRAGAAASDAAGSPARAATAPSTASTSSPSTAAAATPDALARGERRQLSVLFCDLAGSTELAARLDPEDWAEIAARYQRAAADAVLSVRGYVAKYLGDGILAYFGYPKAHDNDAERAVTAGRRIVAAVAALNESMCAERGVKLAVRVGIHTGWVAIEAGGGVDLEIFGDTPNLAARVQTAAEPDSVFVTEATHGLVAGFFVVDDRGLVPLKGIAAPVQLYRVVGATGVRGRMDVATRSGLTPFVGRDEPCRLLAQRWQQVRAGAGRFVLVSGEVGMGKSRLVQSLREQIGGDPHTWVELQCVADRKRTAFHPIADMLERALLPRTDEAGDDGGLPRLESALALAGLDAKASLPMLAPLLGLPPSARTTPLELTAEEQRRRLVATLVDWVRGLAALQPLVAVVEDVQWADPSTLELLTLLAEQGASVAVLFIGTSRPSFRPPWPTRAHHTQVVLDRLEPEEARAVVTSVARAAALAPSMVDAVVARADGVPLFLEELTKLVLEQDGGRSLGEHAIPSTIQGSLVARLDRLGTAREVAQVASVIGREFSYGLLRSISSLMDDDLQAALARLAAADLVQARGLPPDATYAFKHALVQETAYESLLKSRRRDLHAAIARSLDGQLAADAAGRAETLAHHWAEAGEIDAAVTAWEQAGMRAMAGSAHVEAALHFEAGIALLPSLPDTPERSRRELVLQMHLGEALAWKRGYGAPEVASAYGRARAMCALAGEESLRELLSLGLWMSETNRGELRSAQQLADEMLATAEREGSPPYLVWGHFVQGATRLLRGEMPTANEHLDRAIGLYRAEDHRAALMDPGVAALAMSGPTSWYLGFADRARRRATEALALGERLEQSYSVAFARDLAGLLYVALEDNAAVLANADALTDLAGRRGLPLFAAHAAMQGGWAMARVGRGDGLAELRRGVALLTETGERLGLGHYLSLLAETLAALGESDEARATIDAAIRATPEEGHDKPEIFRRRGDILLRADAAAAEASYREAIAVAERAGAVGPGLRAATALARLLVGQGREAEARAALDLFRAARAAGGAQTSGDETRKRLRVEAASEEPR